MTSCVGNTCDDPDSLLAAELSSLSLVGSAHKDRNPSSLATRFLNIFSNIPANSRVGFPKPFLKNKFLPGSP
jgi:hypothetical protein